MANFGQQYAWQSGLNQPLGSLINIANQLYGYNYRATNGARHNVGISSPIVDLQPVRTMLAAGYERGDGRVDHEWNMTISVVAFDFIMDTYLSSGTLVKAAMTIYTRRHETGLNQYARYNAYLIKPSRVRGDIEYLRGNMVRARFPFTGLVAL